MKNNLLFKFILFVLALLTLWVSRDSISALWTWISDRETVTASMQRAGLWGPMVLFILFVLQVFLAFIPGQALMVACGYLYGFWGGFLLSWLSLVIGGEIAFLFARRYGRAFAEKWISNDVLTRWDRAAESQGIAFFALSLVIPLVPNDAMCYVAGLGKISHRRFSLANLLGRGLACIVMSWIGAFGLQAPPYIWMIVMVICAGVAFWVICKRVGISPQMKKKFANAAGMMIVRTYQKIFRIRYEAKGLETLPDGPKIIAINHTNVTDIAFLPLTLSGIPRFVVQGDLFQVPVLGEILKGTGQIPVNPGNRHKAFEQALELLRQGETILIFPEGQLVPFGERVKAWTGTVRLSLATGVPIIPLGIYADPQNVTALMIRRNGRPRKGHYQFRGNCYLRFGAAWQPDPSKQKPVQIHAQTDELMDRIYSLVSEIQKEAQCVSHTLLNPIPQW